MVGEFVADGTGDLCPEQIGVVSEVPQQRVAEDHDPVVEEVLSHGVALVEAVCAPATTAIGDDDRDMLERSVELERKVVDRPATQPAKASG